MRLVHTLLFLFRKEKLAEDIKFANNCLKSLENSTYKTVVIYNQGFLENEQVESFVSTFNLNCIVIGGAVNVGTSVGRQSCFEYIWEHFPDTEYISETHLDMIFSRNWEDPLINWLESNDEPLICCGIVDQGGTLCFYEKATSPVPAELKEIQEYLEKLKEDVVVRGFTNPCIHVSKILKAAGGYDAHFLTGMHAFEDDSMLLGYFYYYGARANWNPKVNFNSVVYHAVAGQRFGLNDSVNVNYYGLVKQYGAMGLKHLSQLHTSIWQTNFFSNQYASFLK